MNDKVLYFHINNLTGEVFYVGIGNIKRPYSKRRTKFWNNIVNKYGYDISIEETGLSKERACELEIYWIKRIGRRDLGLGPLVNQTDGGDGTSNIVVSNETKIKMSLSQKGKNRNVTDKHRESLSKSLSGRKLSQEHKDKLSKAKKGKPGNKLGYKYSQEQLDNLSKLSKGKPWTQARRDAEKNKKIKND